MDAIQRDRHMLWTPSDWIYVIYILTGWMIYHGSKTKNETWFNHFLIVGIIVRQMLCRERKISRYHIRKAGEYITKNSS